MYVWQVCRFILIFHQMKMFQKLFLRGGATFFETFCRVNINIWYKQISCQSISLTQPTVSQSVSGTLDRPRVVAPSKTCGHVRSSRRRWRWAQCPRSAAPTFGRVVHAGASTLAWCPVYRLCERPQPGVVRSELVSAYVSSIISKLATRHFNPV